MSVTQKQALRCSENEIWQRAMEAIRAERREKGCNSETSAQIALKMKFGKEKVLSKRKGK